MANNETGHATNLANFKVMIDECTAYGPMYNPGNLALTTANMTGLWTVGNTAHSSLTTAFQLAKAPINQRQELFDSGIKLVTRTFNMFKSSGADSRIIEDAKGLADRYRGHGRKPKKLPDGTPDPDYVSTSHQGFVDRADTFRQLITLIEADANYKPNEVELQVSALEALGVQMKNANDAIGSILAPVGAARIARDKALYAETTGMVDVALNCKNYVKAVFGPSSPQAKAVGRIKFTRK